MRVLVLCHEWPPLGGGGGRIAFELARRLAAGHELEVLTAGQGRDETVVDDSGLVIHRLACGRRHREYSTSTEKLGYVWAALRQARRWRRRFDLVHSHFIVPAGLVARYGTGPLPYLITCHGSDVPGHNPYESAREHALLAPLWQQVVKRAGAVVSPSRNLEGLLRQAAPHLGPALQRIPNGYPAGRFQQTSYQPRILMLSRLIPLKGFQWFLQGLRGVRLPYEINLVGDGPLRGQLEQLARETPTPVVFHGWLDNDDPLLRELFETSSLFVFPSEAENFPTVLLEAMDAGLAIVTTNVKGCPEVAGEAAVCVPARSPEGLVRAVQDLIADEEGLRRLGAAARRRVRQEFDWPLVAAQYERLYESVANGR